MRMTGTEAMQDRDDLDDLFAAARASRPVPSEALMARVLADHPDIAVVINNAGLSAQARREQVAAFHAQGMKPAEMMARLGVTLPPPGEYGVGMIFLPKEHASRQACEQELERAIQAEIGRASCRERVSSPV